MPFAIIATEASGALGIGLAGASHNADDWAVVAEPFVAIGAFQGLDHGLVEAALALLKEGIRPIEVLDRLSINPDGPAWQALLVDAQGRAAARSGRRCEPAFGHTTGTDHVAAGTALRSPNVIGAMSLSFERSVGDSLVERLLFALESGERAGSDRRALRSALIQVVAGNEGAAVTLRADDHGDPIGEIRRAIRG